MRVRHSKYSLFLLLLSLADRKDSPVCFGNLAVLCTSAEGRTILICRGGGGSGGGVGGGGGMGGGEGVTGQQVCLTVRTLIN